MAAQAVAGLARSFKVRTDYLNFEIPFSAIILDRNSQGCFHKRMVTEELTMSAMHDGVHSHEHNKSSAIT